MLTREEVLEVLREELSIGSSVDDLRLFVDGPVWEDLYNSLKTTIESLRDELETLGPEGRDEGIRLAEFAFLQGQLAALRVLVDLPKLLLITKESEMREKEDERNR